MARRNTLERRDAILKLLDQQGSVSVDQLTQQFSTSEVTIRKDLSVLEQAERLVRTYGGAVAREHSELSATNDNTFETKVSDAKLAIAQRAVQIIPKQARVILDSGSTTAAMLPFLRQRRDLVVMTNALSVAQRLTAAETGPTVLMTGGTWDAQSSSFQGKMAEQMLQAYNFDFAFIGASGLDPELGTTTFNELTKLTQTMAQVADRVVIVAESSKLQRKIPNVELPWSSIDSLITDSGMSKAQQKQIKTQQVDVICVEPAKQ